MMLNCFGIDKLHDFMMHSVMLAVCRISRENDYSFQFSNVGSYDNYIYLSVEVYHFVIMFIFIICRLMMSIVILKARTVFLPARYHRCGDSLFMSLANLLKR